MKPPSTGSAALLLLCGYGLGRLLRRRCRQRERFLKEVVQVIRRVHAAKRGLGLDVVVEFVMYDDLNGLASRRNFPLILRGARDAGGVVGRLRVPAMTVSP